MEHLILTFRLPRCLTGRLGGTEGLLRSRRLPGCLRCLGAAAVMWPAGPGQPRLGGWRLRESGALLLPGLSRALQILFLQLPHGNLHVGARVSVPMTSGADLLEMLCRVGT